MMRCALALMFAVLLQTKAAAAQTCTAVTTDFDFGSVSLRASAVNRHLQRQCRRHHRLLGVAL